MSAGARVSRAPLANSQLVLEWGHEEARSEDDFMVTEDNRLGFEHVLAWPDWPSASMLIQGPAKSGKSHLARIWQARAGAVAGSPETLEALAQEDATAPLLIEDIDRVAYPEVPLFHVLNHALRGQRCVLMTARASVADWPYQTNDVRSRARQATAFTISAPDDILLSQMLVKLFADRQLPVDPKVIAYLVSRMERSSEEAVALVGLLDTLSLAKRKGITRALAAEALALRESQRGD